MSKLGQGQSLRTSTTIRIDPGIILASQMLEWNQAELEQAVESELNENPALARIDDGDPAPTAEEILRSVAPRELKPMDGCHELWRSTPKDSEQEVDWVELTGSSDSLWDHLRGQMIPEWAGSHSLLEYVVGSVNERGYLACTPEEAALESGTSLEEAEAAIALLKTCEPAGVGAADLRECLLLQLRNPVTEEEKLAKLILKNDWELLIQKDTRGVKRRYKVPLEFVDAAFAHITNLNPFPGEGFSPASVNRAERTSIARPDVVLARDERGWSVEIPGPSVLSLRIDRGYEKRYRELSAGANAPKDEKRHVSEFVDRAQRFLEAVSQRRRLMAEIGRYLIDAQNGFVSTGEYRFLKPLTRCQVAKDLGSHESTVSRATSGKFVQIATGEIVAFDVFFRPALRVQKMIEEILSTENPDSPLSDESIKRILEENGIKVARRTVNKYRDRSKHLSSRRRKSA